MSLARLLASTVITGSLAGPVSPHWQESKEAAEKLLIDPSSLLTSKQKNLIFSGFPAYSRVELIVYSQKKSFIVRTRECAIQYDLWEEKFDSLLPESSPRNYPSAAAYFDQCLSIRLNDSPQVRTLIKTSAAIKVRVSLTQISGKANSSITQWLVGQQSNVLKGLFSHMLGELKLSETSEHIVKLPEDPARKVSQ